MSTPVRTRWIDIAPGFAGHLALPPAGHGPGLLLWQEIFGVNEHIQAVAAQYALDGFVVLAPDTFWRQAPRVQLGYEGADRAQALALMQAYAPAQAAADIAASVATLRGLAEVGGRKVGAIGYCMGGRLAYQTAAAGGVDAAVAYYGGGIHANLEAAARIACPMQFHYAEHDDHIPLDAVARVQAALPAAEVHVYPGAMHGFNCWARGSYQPAAAALAHGRSLGFLAAQLWGA